ncbi:MAG: indolepyruvate ferredoxin oxidoreductase subunit alpha, partial [Thermoplasmata archaeon]|nr:indolepyruvate ferredoxin oxidoreductase subunit alpha [Thermoplasmata archaeon]
MADILSPPGATVLLLGNEAIARGALEAGVDVAATYPGTPSSEIGGTFEKVAQKAGVYFEYSINEKVALEVAAGAAMAGLRSFAFMKHVGVNVASDALMTLATTGVRGGMVVLSADDPSAHSSQNEQDNRFFAKFGNLPMLEPSTPAEAKEMMVHAFTLSEELELPVLFRTTTRVNHARGPVKLGDLGEHRRAEWTRDPRRFVTVPTVARLRRPWVLQQMARAAEASEGSPFNIAEGEGDTGIIASGVSSTYVMDALPRLGLDARLLRLGMSHPLPRRTIGNFVSGVERVIVVEELEPYLEEQVKAIAHDAGLSTPVNGKADGHFPRMFEYDVDIVERGISSALGLEYEAFAPPEVPLKVPSRPPNLCPGCPHRATFYAAKVASKGKAVYPMDIGCYTLGMLPPLEVADVEICMGSSIGTACGLSKVLDQPVIAWIGDSTFFHSGIPPLVNAVHNRHDFVLAILDNGTTAMTGHQPHPGTPMDGMGGKAPKVQIPRLVEGLGIDFVEVVNPYHVSETIDVFRRALEHEGIAVVIPRMVCALLVDVHRRSIGKEIVPHRVDQEKCRKCRTCIEKFG